MTPADRDDSRGRAGVGRCSCPRAGTGGIAAAFAEDRATTAPVPRRVLREADLLEARNVQQLQGGTVNRRLPHTPATPARTGGDDRPTGACYGLAERMAPDPTPFDVLTDHSAGPAFEAARREARDLCGVRADGKFRTPEDRCPLAAVCLLRDNAEEPWARAVLPRSRAVAA